MLNPVLTLTLALTLPSTEAPRTVAEEVWLGRLAPADGAPVLAGFGPDYAVEFDHGLVFAPRGAEPGAAVRLELVELELGGGVFHRPEGTRAPRRAARDDLRVTYDLGPWGEERFTLGRRGVEQVVVLERLPTGGGDLVVRMAVRGAAGVLRDDGAVVFAGDGEPAVRVDGLVIFDALGRRAAGRLACTGDKLTYTVPAAFVASAALPLFVEPLVGTDFHYGSPLSGKSVSPDVAYSEHHDGYGIVWQRATPSGLNVVLFAPAWSIGSQAGPTLVLDSTTAPLLPPRIADIWEGRMFVVVWGIQSATSTRVDVAVLEADDLNGTWYRDFEASIYEPRLATFDLGGGEERKSLLACATESGIVFARGLEPVLDPADFEEVSPPLEEDQTLYTTARMQIAWQGIGEVEDGNITVSRSDPFLVAWERSHPGGDVDVYGIPVMSAWSPRYPEVPLFADPGREETAPSVAGEDGAYVVTVMSDDGAFEEVFALQVALDAPCPSCTLVPVSAPVLLDIWPTGSVGLLAPSVGSAGATFVVTWVRGAGGGLWDIVAAELDAADLSVCEPEYVVDQTPWATTPRLSDDLFGGVGALVVWAGAHPAYGAPETMGALIQACSY